MDVKQWFGMAGAGVGALVLSVVLNQYKDPSEIAGARQLSDGTAPKTVVEEASAPVKTERPTVTKKQPAKVAATAGTKPAPTPTKKPGKKPKPAKTPVNIGGGAARAKGGAVIKGVVKWSGKAPKNSLIDMGSDPVCKGLCAGKEQRGEKVVVNENGTLKNVVVYVAKVPKGNYAAKTEPVVINQVNCRYVPHVFAVQIGQELKIQNSDDTTHNIHFKSKFNDSWNMTQSSKGVVPPAKKFMRQEVGTSVFKCDVHTWMEARAAIFEHPFFAVTGDDGSFEITGDLPPGKYKLMAWHEKYKTIKCNVTVGETVAEVEFTYAKKKKARKGAQVK